MNLLGCSWSYIAVLFDLWVETRNCTHFHIYKNIVVDGEPILVTGNPSYVYQIYEPGSMIVQPDMGLSFGLTGPWAKYQVFKWFRDLQGLAANQYSPLIHPTVYLPVSAILEGGHILEPGVIISSHARLAFGVTIKRGASIGHHSQLGPFTEINPGVVISSNVNIGTGCIIGTGAMIRDGVSIGANSVIGIGSVVTKDIPEGVVAYGNPCKVIGENQKWKLPDTDIFSQ